MNVRKAFAIILIKQQYFNNNGQSSVLTEENKTERKYLFQCHTYDNSTQTLAQITLFNGEQKPIS